MQIGPEDAARLGIEEGDWLRVTSRRGKAEAQARIREISPGTAFMPFDYGYWDAPGQARAANELTIFGWDPVSKQPYFKYAAVKVEKVPSPTTIATEVVELHPDGSVQGQPEANVEPKGEIESHISDYLGLLSLSEARLVKALHRVRTTHPKDPDISEECKMIAQWSEGHRGACPVHPEVRRAQPR